IWHHKALGLHALGREAMRRALLEAGLNDHGSADERAELQRRLGQALVARAMLYGSADQDNRDAAPSSSPSPSASEPGEPEDVKMFSACLHRLWRNWRPGAQVRPRDLRSYYNSPEPVGPARLRDLLQESAFFSGELYAMAARRSLVWSLVLLAG